MNSWTIFYIGWWVAWAAFVGLFIARISEGRTIRSVVMYSFICPLGYTVSSKVSFSVICFEYFKASNIRDSPQILWFGVFGGAGIRQARQALEMEELGATWYNNSDHFLSEDSTYCYDVPQEDIIEDGEVVFTNTLVGVTPVCKFNSGTRIRINLIY